MYFSINRQGNSYSSTLSKQCKEKIIVFPQGINQRSGFVIQLEQSNSHQRSWPTSFQLSRKKFPPFSRACSISGPGHGEAEQPHPNGLGFKLTDYAYFFKGTLQPKDGGHAWGCKGVLKGGWNWIPLISNPDRCLPNSSVFKVNPHQLPICSMWLALKNLFSVNFHEISGFSGLW